MPTETDGTQSNCAWRNESIDLSSLSSLSQPHFHYSIDVYCVLLPTLGHHFLFTFRFTFGIWQRTSEIQYWAFRAHKKERPSSGLNLPIWPKLFSIFNLNWIFCRKWENWSKCVENSPNIHTYTVHWRCRRLYRVEHFLTLEWTKLFQTFYEVCVSFSKLFPALMVSKVRKRNWNSIHVK